MSLNSVHEMSSPSDSSSGGPLTDCSRSVVAESHITYGNIMVNSPSEAHALSYERSQLFEALISSALFLGTSAIRLGYTLILRGLASNRVQVKKKREVFDLVLSPRTVAVVRATAPKIARHVNEIANKFYTSFFGRYPEMKSLFSLSHGTVIEENMMDAATRLRSQASGRCPVIGVLSGRKSVSGSQVRAMANTIMSFALHVDAHDGNIDFDSLIARIVHKHVSHHITPDMYPLLGECLLQAIFNVLGDVASGDVVRAWRDAYWWLAEKLMYEEDRLLCDQIAHNHGWEGFRSFVVQKHIESESICSVYLFPLDGVVPLPEFAAGQYITLRLRLFDGFITHRNYSLSDCGKKHYFRISVKRLPGGEASCFIHDSLRSGDIIDVSIPSGTFTLYKYLRTPPPERGPIVFICAGIGMTPLLSMMYSMYNDSSLGYKGLIQSSNSSINGSRSNYSNSSDSSNNNISSSGALKDGVSGSAPTMNSASGDGINVSSDSNSSSNSGSAGSIGRSSGGSTGSIESSSPDVAATSGSSDATTNAPSSSTTANSAATTATTSSTTSSTSMNNSFLPSADSPVLFLHAAKNKRHDCLVEELFSFAATHPHCRVYKVYSLPRPNVDVFGKDYHYAGHIDTHLLRYLLGDAVGRCAFYLCGPDRFMEAQFANIINIGGSRENIEYERFAAGSGSML